jgi:hypothetical protein
MKLMQVGLPTYCHLATADWPHSLSGIWGAWGWGARMRQIISVIYGVLLIAIWLCVMGIVITVLDSGGPKWLLAAAGFVAAVSTVALAEEFVEWRRPLTLGTVPIAARNGHRPLPALWADPVMGSWSGGVGIFL